MKIAAVQMDAAFADVQANLDRFRFYTAQAAASGAELVLFPEFFTSAIGFSPKMLDVALQNGCVLERMRELSRQYQIIIGGSWLSYDGGEVYNAYRLVFPSGEVYTHKKDIPTQFENCYYTRGDTNHFFHTPLGDVGIALCWEMLRYDTVKRLSEKADLIIAGSCWWDLPEGIPEDREPLRHYNQQLAQMTPVTFAKLLHVPVVHAAHSGSVTSYRFPESDIQQTRRFVGAAQIVGADGEVKASRPFTAGEGLVIAELDPTKTERRRADITEDKYWIPDLPESYLNAWERLNPLGEEYYSNIALPYYKNHAQK